MSQKYMKHKVSLFTQFKHILLVFVLVASMSLSTIVSLISPQVAQAKSYDSQLNNTKEPSISSKDEYGIWIDRALIYVYLNSRSDLTDGVSHAFSAKVDGLNKGNIEYQSGCRTLKVNFSDYNSRPSSGTMTSCDGGTETPVTLVNQDNAFLDGYATDFTKNTPGTIFLPRYISGVENCGGVPVSGKYSQDGTFNKSGSKYILNGSDSRTYIDNYSKNSSRLSTAKQSRTSEYKIGGAGQSCTLSYAGDGQDGGRKIYFLNGYTRDEVKLAAANKINDFQTRKQRLLQLQDAFTSDSVILASNECRIRTSTRATQQDLISLLAETGSNRGANPYVDCMLDTLKDNAKFQAAMGYAYDGNYTEELQQDLSDNCADNVGIPLVGQVICWFVKLVFNAINSSFTMVIGYFGNTADTFGRFTRDPQIKTIWSGLKNLASVLFLIAFLIVVFQYMTNINVVDAYFVKKFIPRLVIAIILVQASFWIVSEMNYIATDLGRSIQSLLFYSASGGSTVNINTAGDILASFGPFAIFGGPAAPAIALVVGLVLFLVLILTIFILVIRELLLVVLAILAPLALATIAIPQLESTSKKWLSSYVRLLAMYPIMMLFISVGAIIGNMLNQLGGFFALMGFIAYFLPFLVLPFSFKLAGGIMGQVAGKLQALGTKKGKEMYGNSQFGIRRAKEKEMKMGIRADRAGNKASERTLKKMQSAERGKGIRSMLTRQQLYGATGGTEAERAKYQGVFEQKEKKRKREEADLQVASMLARTTNQKQAVEQLDGMYREAMTSGNVEAAEAAYSALVGQKATTQLETIQADANNGTWGANGIKMYNAQQGDHYGTLGEFAPQLRGDVGQVDANNNLLVGPSGLPIPKDLAEHRASNFRGMSNDQLSAIKPEAWESWARTSPTGVAEAAARYNAILRGGGGAASKLSPDARDKILGQADPADLARIQQIIDAPAP